MWLEELGNWLEIYVLAPLVVILIAFFLAMTQLDIFIGLFGVIIGFYIVSLIVTIITTPMRWLYQLFNWEIFPYTIINLVWGLGIFMMMIVVTSGLYMSFPTVILENDSLVTRFSSISLLGAFLFLLIWFGNAVRVSRSYSTVHWSLLYDDFSMLLWFHKTYNLIGSLINMLWLLMKILWGRISGLKTGFKSNAYISSPSRMEPSYSSVSYRNIYTYKPEENVRAYVIKILTKQLNYNYTDISSEYPIQMGSKQHRADIVIFRPNSRHTQENIVAIIECKRSDKLEPSSAINQLKSYMSAAINCQYGVVASQKWTSIKREIINNYVEYTFAPFPDAHGKIQTIQYLPSEIEE